MSEPDPILCYRCGAVADVKWLVTCTMNDPTPIWIYSWGQCLTDGCAEPNGSTDPRMPTPEQLNKRADQMWVARHRALAEER